MNWDAGQRRETGERTQHVVKLCLRVLTNSMPLTLSQQACLHGPDFVRLASVSYAFADHLRGQVEQSAGCLYACVSACADSKF